MGKKRKKAATQTPLVDNNGNQANVSEIAGTSGYNSTDLTSNDAAKNAADNVIEKANTIDGGMPADGAAGTDGNEESNEASTGASNGSENVNVSNAEAGTVTDTKVEEPEKKIDASALVNAGRQAQSNARFEQRVKGVGDNDFVSILRQAPDEETRDQMMRDWLANGDIQWQDVTRLRNEVADELDPAKKEKRQRAEQRERNLVAALNMIGALGNVYNATSSREGRSVSVPDLAAAVNQKQEQESNTRQKSMDRYEAARQRYGQTKGQILTQGYKDYRTRKKEERELAERQRQFDEKMELDKAKELRAQNKDLLEMQLKLNEDERKSKESEAKIKKYKADTYKAYNTAKGYQMKDIYPIYYKDANGNISYIPVPKAGWNNTTIGRVYSLIPPEVQKEIDSYIKKRSVTKRERPDPKDEAEMAKWIGENKTALEEAIGSVINDERCKEALDFILGMKDAKPTEQKRRTTINFEESKIVKGNEGKEHIVFD